MFAHAARQHSYLHRTFTEALSMTHTEKVLVTNTHRPNMLCIRLAPLIHSWPVLKKRSKTVTIVCRNYRRTQRTGMSYICIWSAYQAREQHHTFSDTKHLSTFAADSRSPYLHFDFATHAPPSRSMSLTSSTFDQE